VIELSTAEFLWFVDDCLDDMTTIVESLGDDLANRRPPLPDANAPYAILTHCLGVLEFWGGLMVAGREIHRDREAEFRATGPVTGLRQHVRQARERFVADLEALEPRDAPAGPVPEKDRGTPFGTSQAGVLMHVFHELAQHRGQLELTRDLLRADPEPRRP
jgi:uncharacterized damage-inducible protein DinB